MNKLRLLIVIVVVVCIVFAAQCLYTVKPYQAVIQLRFGRMIKPLKVFEGYNLYLKWPSLIDKYMPIDQRLQVTDAVLETINTSGRQEENFQISAACSGFWKVTDPAKFYISLLSTVKNPVPEPGGSFPKTVNDAIRASIRSGVNNVFGETQFSELFGLPLFTGTINRDCLALDGNTLLPANTIIRGGQIRATSQIERRILQPDGTVVEPDPSQYVSTPCIVIILYGYQRESARTSATGPQAQVEYSWKVTTDPAGAEGLGRKELILTVPLKYISNQRLADTVQIAAVQDSITQQVNRQVQDYGVQVARVEVRRLSFPPSSLDTVYNKMKSERQRISGAYRSSGEKDARIILSNAQREASRDVAIAEGRARAIKGRADAQAASIAAAVQKKNPEFYVWLQNLETAAEILKNKAWVVLSTDQPVIQALFGGLNTQRAKPSSSATTGK